MTESAVQQHPQFRTPYRFVRPTVMQRLADATRAEHQHIERNSLLAQLLQSDVSVSHYRRVLAGFHGFYRPLETQLLANPDVANHRDLASRLGKHRLLAADLRTLEVSARQCQALPHCEDLPVCKHWHEILGVMYVLEGATLGGQLIRKQLLAHLDARWHGALRFYSCYGDQVGERWRTFQQLLAGNLPDDPADEHLSMAISAARQTFGLMDNWLARTEVGHYRDTRSSGLLTD